MADTRPLTRDDGPPIVLGRTYVVSPPNHYQEARVLEAGASALLLLRTLGFRVEEQAAEADALSTLHDFQRAAATVLVRHGVELQPIPTPEVPRG